MDIKSAKEFGGKVLTILKKVVLFNYGLIKKAWESGVIQKLTNKIIHYGKIIILKFAEWIKIYVMYVLHYFKIFVLNLIWISKKLYVIIRNFKYTLDNVIRILAVIFTIKILVLLFLSFKVNYDRHFFEGEKKIRISIGESFNSIADNLEQEGVIANAFFFKVAAKIQGKDEKIISRTYIFKPGLNNLELLELLTDPSLNFTVKFTVVEGLRIKQIAKLCSNKFEISEKDFIDETQNDSLIRMVGLEGKVNNLEGFLFPDTYRVPADITAKEMVLVLFGEFYKKFILSDKYGFSGNPDKLLKTITLASIIQGETQIDSEMPTIAGVYINRLRKRMKLEADPTVQYVLPDGPKQRLMKKDLKIDSPYNTYLHYGLPPGPINNPGLKSIEAALEPEEHNYVFFVATGKGGHTFSKTYKEHLENVKEYRKNVGQK